MCVPGVQMYVCNREPYGFLPVPLKAQQNVEDESENFIHTITEALSEYGHAHTHGLGFTLFDYFPSLVCFFFLLTSEAFPDFPVIRSLCFSPPPPPNCVPLCFSALLFLLLCSE